jgi:hypothetical protein
MPPDGSIGTHVGRDGRPCYLSQDADCTPLSHGAVCAREAVRAAERSDILHATGWRPLDSVGGSVVVLEVPVTWPSRPISRPMLYEAPPSANAQAAVAAIAGV